MVGFEKAYRAVKDQIQYRSESLLNLARGYFSSLCSVPGEQSDGEILTQILIVVQAGNEKYDKILTFLNGR